MPNFAQLDNPVWHSLNETHQPLALGDEEIKLYPPEVSPFVGINTHDPHILWRLDQYLPADTPFYLLTKLPDVPPHYVVLSELLCVQMVCNEPVTLEFTEEIVPLNDSHRTAVSDLVNLVLPGYFRPGTQQMGDYFGIFKNGQLVAVTGERMRTHRFTEVSAVATHPDWGGRGYAKQLVAHVTNKNLAAGLTPFLHAAATNTSAVGLYEKLGFRHRPPVNVQKLTRTAV
jgi:GNAT superfamily N-acetyltransferase